MVTGDPDSRTLTAKGGRAAEAVLEAAIECLGEHGYAGTSLQRVAEIARVQKRMVLYYYGSRERLIEQALNRLAGRFLDGLERVVDEHDDPDELIDALVEAVLPDAGNRPLLAAYFGLVAESASDPALRETLAEIRTRAERLAERAVDKLEATGRTLSMQRELLFLAVTVAANGLGLELLQHGSSPDLERAVTFARASLPLLLFD